MSGYPKECKCVLCGKPGPSADIVGTYGGNPAHVACLDKVSSDNGHALKSRNARLERENKELRFLNNRVEEEYETARLCLRELRIKHGRTKAWLTGIHENGLGGPRAEYLYSLYELWGIE